MESNFYIFGREIGAQQPKVSLTVVGIDYDGTIHMEDPGGNRHKFSGREVKQLRNDGLIISDSELDAADKNLVAVVDSFNKNVSKASLPSAVRGHTDESMKELFRAVKESAQNGS